MNRKKTFASLAKVGALVVVGIILLMTIAGRDHTAPDTSDLLLQRPVVPSENNAYTFFAAATNTLYWPKDETFVLWYLRGYLRRGEALGARGVFERETQIIRTSRLSLRSARR